jgi:hypothetical protein
MGLASASPISAPQLACNGTAVNARQKPTLSPPCSTYSTFSAAAKPSETSAP